MEADQEIAGGVIGMGHLDLLAQSADLRNLLDPGIVPDMGLTHHDVGRLAATVAPTGPDNLRRP